MDAVRTWPQLRELRVALGEKWQDDIADIIRSCPNLQSLSVSIEDELLDPDDIEFDEIDDPFFPALPVLNSLHLNSAFLLSLATKLFSSSPKFTNLEVDMSIGDYDEAELWARTQHLLVSAQITDLRFRGYFCAGADVYLDFTNSFPNIRRLTYLQSVSPAIDTADIQFGPVMFIPDPNIETLRIDWNDRDCECCGERCITTPAWGTIMTTDIASWFIEGFDVMPSLGLLMLGFDIPIDYRLPRYRSTEMFHAWVSFYCRVYTNGEESLYVMRATFDKWEDIREYFEGLPCDHQSVDSINEHEDGDLINFEEKEPGSIIMTSYHGRALPMCLLKWIYEVDGIPSDWQETGRNLPLPDEIWDVLHGWLEILKASDTE